MRGSSFWTDVEREQMAVAFSRLNECPFCVRVHTETARLAGHSSTRPELDAVIELITALNQSGITPADVARVRAAGVPDDAIVDALHVNTVFNIVNRLANAFDWSWDSDEQVRSCAQVLQRFRYRLPGFVLR